MGADDHPLYLSSPDSTCSTSSSSSFASNHQPCTSRKSFLISDILKPTFGNPQEKYSVSKCNIPLSPSTTNDSTSSSMVNTKAGLLPAWVFCTRYSDRPSAGRIRKSTAVSFEAHRCSRSSRTKAQAVRPDRFETAAHGVHDRSTRALEGRVRSK